MATIEHHERPELLNRLAMLRDQVFVLDHMYMSLFSTCGWILRLGVTVALLMSIHPALGLLAVMRAADGAHLHVAAGRGACRQGTGRTGEPAGAPPVRDGHHGPARQGGARDRHRRSPGGPTAIGVGTLVRARGRGAVGECAVAHARLGRSSPPASSPPWRSSRCEFHARPGDVLLVLAAGSRLSAYIGATVGEIGFLRGIWLDGSRRLAWLEDYAAALVEHCDAPVPERLADGIRFEHVSFAYPGTERRVLEDVCLEFKPGSVVAIVGENGAGKTTLVKLLCRLYQPTSGRILVDGIDLARMPADAWRSRLAGAFQDFFRFEFRARHTVGVGDVPRLDDEPAVVAAVDRAGADDVVARLTAGLETQLGPTWPDGVEVSFGQWQKLALARGFMRDRPLLLVLDEPTAALDAETEHALFERYAAAAHGGTLEWGSRQSRSRWPHHDPRVPSLQHRPDGRSHRRARWLARRRGGLP